jgi:hypothetical protein
MKPDRFFVKIQIIRYIPGAQAAAQFLVNQCHVIPPKPNWFGVRGATY